MFWYLVSLLKLSSNKLGKYMAYPGAKTVSAIAVIDLANEMITSKLIDEADLKALSMEVFNEYRLFKSNEAIVEHRLAEAHLVSLWNLVDAQSDFTFNMGSRVNQQAKGVLANWISYSDTLAQAFDIFTQNVGLLNHAEQWQATEGDTYVELEFQYQSALTYPNVAIERSMVAVIAWGNYFVQQPLVIYSASFSFPKPGHNAEYEKLFGSNITFSSEVNRIVLLKEQFHQQLDSANLYLRNVLQQRSHAIQRSMDSLTSVAASVTELLVKDLAGYSTIENILTALPMSRTTLYRKLKEQSTTFSDLVKQTRLDKLLVLKAQGASSEECAHLLGFTDVSSFYRFSKSL
jgi:AraC-like DNA-binding protein